MLKKVKSLILVALLALPLLASAQSAQSILQTVGTILGYVVPLIMTLALIYFFWGLAKYILGAGDEEAQKGARSMMIYGVIILFVMAAVWGLVRVIGNTFGISTTNPAPTVDLPN